MKPAVRWARRVGVAALVVAGFVLAVRAWVVPGLIAGQLSTQFHGPASFEGWWLGDKSAGVRGLSLKEGAGSEGKEWLSARRVTTDLSIGGLLSGHVAPGRITIEGVRIKLRLDAKGNVLTKGPFEGGSKGAKALPDVEIKDGEVTLEQEGRPPLVVRGVSGLLDRADDGEHLSFATDDPQLGRWTLEGTLDPGFAAGTIRLASGPGFATTPELNRSVPFVPPEVWQNVTPSGPVDVAVTIDLGKTKEKPLEVRTEVGLGGVSAKLNSLGVVAEGATGRITVVDGVVRVEKLSGRTLSGTLDVGGTLDFAGAAPHFDVALSLGRIDVAAAPASWQLGEVGASGRLTGKVHLVATLSSGGPDLSGSSGEAVIDGATLQGIPIKSLRLAMHAEGTDLQFETKPEPKTSAITPPSRLIVAGALVALQAPTGPKQPAREPAKSAFSKLRLPKSITTQVELEDVDLKKILEKLESMTKIKIPAAVAGRLSLKAEATIPLGHIADVKDYTIKGHATLTGASIDGVDLGRVSARFGLDKGVLDLDELQGQLVDRPSGDATSPPKATPPRAVNDPPLPGSFRGKLRAELSPEGRLAAHFEASEVPIGELVAPYFPKPTPVAGRLTAVADASAEVARLRDARAWSASGRISSRQLSYQGSALDAIDAKFTLDQGKLGLPDLAAKLGGNPLKARFALDLADRRAFSGEVDVSDWSVDRVLALVPNAPRPAPVAGQFDGHVAVQGTLQPLVVKSDGKVLLRAARVESIPLGDVSASWATEGDEIRVKEVSARPFSGRFTGEAVIPIAGGRPIQVRARLDAIDTAKLAASLGEGGVKLSGIASGRLTATIPPDFKDLTADLSLASTSLVVQGVPTGTVSATVRGKGEKLEYSLTTDGPEGKVSFRGDYPLSGEAKDRNANAELRAAGFSIADVLELAGMKGMPGLLHGQASIDANLRARVPGPMALGVHGFVGLRDVRWGAYPVGNIHGVLSKGPDSWRLDSLRGDVLGGDVSGVFWGETPPAPPRPISFDIQAERIALARVVAFVPHLAKRLDGYGSLRLTGRMEESLRASAEVDIPRARFAGITLSDLRLPAEVTFHPGDGVGLVQSRRWTARIGGGRVNGSASQRLGADRSFVADLNLTDLEIESITRVESNSARPGSGKLNGRVTLHGPDPRLPHRYKGRIDIDLDDAAIGDIPVVRELGKFFGAAQGAAFEDGDLHATISNHQVNIDEMTLEGRVIQCHITGTVSFDGRLDLAILVNTNQLISETGQTLVGLIPGLREVLGRSDEAMQRVTTFLSNRLLKFRVGGTLKNPSVAIDPGVVVTQAAGGFFSGVLKLPLGLVR